MHAHDGSLLKILELFDMTARHLLHKVRRIPQLAGLDEQMGDLPKC